MESIRAFGIIAAIGILFIAFMSVFVSILLSYFQDKKTKEEEEEEFYSFRDIAHQWCHEESMMTGLTVRAEWSDDNSKLTIRYLDNLGIADDTTYEELFEDINEFRNELPNVEITVSKVDTTGRITDPKAIANAWSVQTAMRTCFVVYGNWIDDRHLDIRYMNIHLDKDHNAEEIEALEEIFDESVERLRYALPNIEIKTTRTIGVGA